ncbi:AEC family transporter [Bacillus sp. Marseille-P3661]|uniref:AEC family transporter n=1 Tax=Bacillus sp. Marseille-P3661 TaxID=1936234 RepID=UPI000C825654|nr:AEC family transporter [Bacillus sp. Marseille-P3661]
MNIFIQVVLPVLLVFVAGFAIQKWRKLHIASVSAVGIYIMTPALVFRTFHTAELNIDYLNMLVFSFILLFAIILINKVYVKVKKYPPSLESGLILSTAFMNSGNYGAPIILFAYGEVGFAYSISILVIHSIFMNVFGVYYAARGESGYKLALKLIFQMPATYALIIALLFNWLNIKIPTNISSVVDIVADATIPTIMLVLGMQLAEISLKGMRWSEIIYGSIVRLFISPLLAIAIIFFIPMDPLLEKVLIVSSAMPTAAGIVLYAVQFDAEPDLVSGTTLVNTLISVITVTLLLIILG